MSEALGSLDFANLDSIQFINNCSTGQADKTIVVFGLGRGGTSAVAGLCRILGVAMPHAHPLKHEFSPVVYGDNGIDRAATWQNIRALDFAHATWGWKSPQDVFVESQYMSMLRNPHVIVVFRNPLDVVNGSMRAENIDFISSVRPIGRVYEELFQFIWTTPVPLALVNFERLRADVGRAVGALGNWLGVAPSLEQLHRAVDFVAVRRGEYRSIESGEAANLTIDAAEIAIDQAYAQITLYTDEIRLLASRVAALRDDLDAAQDMKAALLEELNQTQVSSELLNHVPGDDAVGPTLAVPPIPPAAPDDAAMLADHARHISVIYYKWREYYHELADRRRIIQNEMDTLAVRLGRRL